MSAPALAVRDLSKNFRGLSAVSNVSFTVPCGSLTALIGPNGAGKTTVFNLVTNLFRPSAGIIEYYGRNVTGLTPAEIARLGLIRTFQTARVFPGMTTLSNVLAGAHLHLRGHPLQQMLRLPSVRREERELRRKAEALLELAGLAGFRDSVATDLPMGAQKMLEVVRALMAQPRLLLLDEPAAGLNDAETGKLARLLRAIRKAGVTMVVVEHNMSLVMGVADQIVVLDAGSIVATGPPQDIQRDRRVIAVYIGQTETAA